jgi:hypothetical protein
VSIQETKKKIVTEFLGSLAAGAIDAAQTLQDDSTA